MTSKPLIQVDPLQDVDENLDCESYGLPTVVTKH